MKFPYRRPDASGLVAMARSAAPALLALAIAGCAGPPVLERQVLGYDEVTSRLDQKLLLLNIARTDNGMPVHFTSTSTIAATFNWTTTLGIGGEWRRSSGDSFLGLNVGSGASENPTFSIHPLSGQAFTERILTPFKDQSFEFLVFQGGAIDRVTRLLASGIEVQNADSSFVRFIANDPARPAGVRRVPPHRHPPALAERQPPAVRPNTGLRGTDSTAAEGSTERGGRHQCRQRRACSGDRTPTAATN
jgi:hypothetical protein